MSVLLENEVFVRAYCAALGGLAGNHGAVVYIGREAEDAGNETGPAIQARLKAIATNLAADAVDAWRHRPTKPGVQHKDIRPGTELEELRRVMEKLDTYLNEEGDDLEAENALIEAYQQWCEGYGPKRDEEE